MVRRLNIIWFRCLKLNILLFKGKRLDDLKSGWLCSEVLFEFGFFGMGWGVGVDWCCCIYGSGNDDWLCVWGFWEGKGKE